MLTYKLRITVVACTVLGALRVGSRVRIPFGECLYILLFPCFVGSFPHKISTTKGRKGFTVYELVLNRKRPEGLTHDGWRNGLICFNIFVLFFGKSQQCLNGPRDLRPAACQNRCFDSRSAIFVRFSTAQEVQ